MDSGEELTGQDVDAVTQHAVGFEVTQPVSTTMAFALRFKRVLV